MFRPPPRSTLRRPSAASDVYKRQDYPKATPGFSVIRKGGTDGDPVFRGMAASRVNLLIDGQPVLGGCGMRMDPPTAYVFPAAYDRVVVIKGPHTVPVSYTLLRAHETVLDFVCRLLLD